MLQCMYCQYHRILRKLVREKKISWKKKSDGKEKKENNKRYQFEKFSRSSKQEYFSLRQLPRSSSCFTTKWYTTLWEYTPICHNQIFIWQSYKQLTVLVTHSLCEARFLKRSYHIRSLKIGLNTCCVCHQALMSLNAGVESGMWICTLVSWDPFLALVACRKWPSPTMSCWLFLLVHRFLLSDCQSVRRTMLWE